MTSTILRYATLARAGGGFALAAAIAGATPAAAEQTCWTAENAQFFNAIKYCVSSVLAPAAGATYGPANLTRHEGNAARAWCEGAPDFGFGETIRIEIKGGPAFRRLLVGNGYAKSPETYRNNARVRTVEIIGDNGLAATLDLPDRSDIVPIELPKMPQNWIELKIVDVYPGVVAANTCLGFLMPDFEHEEELLLRQQGLIK